MKLFEAIEFVFGIASYDVKLIGRVHFRIVFAIAIETKSRTIGTKIVIEMACVWGRWRALVREPNKWALRLVVANRGLLFVVVGKVFYI